MPDAPRPSREQDPGRLDESLVSLATGELDGPEAARIEAEIAADPRRRSELAMLRRVLSVMAEGPWPAPGSKARAAVLEAFSSRAARAARAAGPASSGPAIAVDRLVRAASEWIEAAECVVADLVFDRRAQVAMPGFRGAGGGVSYAADCGRLDLDIQSSDVEAGTDRGVVRVRGQFRETSGAVVHAADRRVLVVDERGLPVVDAVTDERGAFQIELKSGRVDLIVGLADGRRFAVRDLVVD